AEGGHVQAVFSEAGRAPETTADHKPPEQDAHRQPPETAAHPATLTGYDDESDAAKGEARCVSTGFPRHAVPVVFGPCAGAGHRTDGSRSGTHQEPVVMSCLRPVVFC
ncbi:hypothetical protein C9415_27730, partial [Kluyvera sp. Nf5]